MPYRSFIRKTISHIFYRFIYENERFNGVAELLEILGAIINGFAVPLKMEHIMFLQHVLIPLHKPRSVMPYHQHLSYCILQFVEKDTETSIQVVNGLLRIWPWSFSMKQVIFLSELEEILELIEESQLEILKTNIFALIAKCLGSEHFQVVERTLLLWNNTNLTNSGCLSRRYIADYLPVFFEPLYRQSNGHWSTIVEATAQNVLRICAEQNQEVYNKCISQYTDELEVSKMNEKEVENKWEYIKKLVS